MCPMPSCSNSIIPNKIKNSHKSLERTLTQAEYETVSLSIFFIYSYIYSIYANKVKQSSDRDKLIHHPNKSHQQLCHLYLDKRAVISKKFFFCVTSIIHHGCNKDNNLPAS